MEDLRLEPVGYIESCFKYKNGTPRQPGICASSQAKLTIRRDVYNNPEHSLEGLEKFSHVWILFVFHKNNNAYKKAKVQPPRLNGAKVGVFSTRSPYRLNPIGLTLVQIQEIAGDTLYMSGVDMLDGTPVIDIKPYIAAYDRPSLVNSSALDQSWSSSSSSLSMSASQFDTASSPSSASSTEVLLQKESSSDSDSDDEYFNPNEYINPKDYLHTVAGDTESDSSEGSPSQMPHHQSRNPGGQHKYLHKQHSISSKLCSGKHSNQYQALGTDSSGEEELLKQYTEEKLQLNELQQSTAVPQKRCSVDAQDLVAAVDTPLIPLKLSCTAKHKNDPKELESQTAEWISAPPIPELKVSFTNTALGELKKFTLDSTDKKYLLQYVTNAEAAITEILEADPRSTYRRTKCRDKLYYFVVDTMHITAWFNDDSNIAEVLRVKPITDVPHLNDTTN